MQEVGLPVHAERRAVVVQDGPRDLRQPEIADDAPHDPDDVGGEIEPLRSASARSLPTSSRGIRNVCITFSVVSNASDFSRAFFEAISFPSPSFPFDSIAYDYPSV